MYFNFACSQCGKNLKVREENAGRKARCPYCHATVVVPEADVPQVDAPTPTSPLINTSATSTAPSAASRRKPTRSRSAASSSSKQQAISDGTNISLPWTALIGLGLTVGFYILLFPFSGTYFKDLFYDRGWVTPAEAYLLFWSIAILIFKSRLLLRQRESMLFDVLPDSLAPEITAKSLDKFAKHARELPVNSGSSFLVQRVLRGLEHFRVRRSASETATMLASQSEIDAVAVESSYAILNVFIWAIPILGFIGTVQGLGDAVGQLSGSLEGASDVNEIKGALQGITTGLGTAFDTTLVALIMSLLLKFPASSMQKAEEDLLNSVDEYCNENLMRRLNDGSESTAELEPNTAVVKQLIESVGKQMTQLVQQHQQATADLSRNTVTVQKQVADSMQKSTESIHRQVAGLEKGLAGLNQVLGQLGQKQIVIKTEPVRKRGWFSRRNGA